MAVKFKLGWGWVHLSLSIREAQVDMKPQGGKDRELRKEADDVAIEGVGLDVGVVDGRVNPQLS